MNGRYNPERHNRRSIRLKGYDYAQSGAYFVTICTQNRECLFGDIQRSDMVLNNAGRMAKTTWDDLLIKCPGIAIDEFIVMPNHVHGIIFIVGAPLVGALLNRVNAVKDRAGTRPATTLGDVVGIFKSITTHQYAINVTENNWQAFPDRLWQRNYYEHIIRNENELNETRKYIRNNPMQWDMDTENPINLL